MRTVKRASELRYTDQTVNFANSEFLRVKKELIFCQKFLRDRAECQKRFFLCDFFFGISVLRPEVHGARQIFFKSYAIIFVVLTILRSVLEATTIVLDQGMGTKLSDLVVVALGIQTGLLGLNSYRGNSGNCPNTVSFQGQRRKI